MNRATFGRRRLLWLLCIGTAGLVIQAEASSMTLLDEDRFVSISNTAPAPYALVSGVTTTNPPAAPFNNASLKLQGSLSWFEVSGFRPDPTLAAATQEVAVSTSEIALSSMVDVRAGGDPLGLHLPAGATGTARAESFFEVTFRVDEPTAFVYAFDVAPSPILDTAEMVLDSLNFGPQILGETSGVPVPGLLEPDTYRLRVHLVGVAVDDLAGRATSDMYFQLLPEPSTALLIGVGIAALSGLRASRRDGTVRVD